MMHEYSRKFVCNGCIGVFDGKRTIMHEKPHVVWVQDMLASIDDHEVVFWKDATCNEVGFPCCHFQTPCTVASTEEIFTPKEATKNESPV